MTVRFFPHVAFVTGAVAFSSASAQTNYRNLDAGQPLRVEDAEVAARYSFAGALSPLQFEHLAGGSSRYRAEPRISYGLLPLTEIELRVPMVELIPPAATGAASTSGVAGVSVGIARAFTIETGSIPALAISAEMSLPVGALAGAQGSFIVKGLMTKTIGALRFHANAGAGTYAIGIPKSSSSSDCSGGIRLIVAGDTTCNAGPIIIFDAPCSVSPGGARLSALATRSCMRPPPADSVTIPPPTSGKRWFAGLGVDHAFPLRSTLIAADVFAERFVGLYSKVDWTAEIGVRHQLTPIVVVDVGVGRHFAGTIPSTFLVGGASFEFATSPWLSR